MPTLLWYVDPPAYTVAGKRKRTRKADRFTTDNLNLMKKFCKAEGIPLCAIRQTTDKE